MKLLFIILLLPVLASAQIHSDHFPGNTATVEYRYQVIDSAGRLLQDIDILRDERTGEAWVADGNTGMYMNKRFYRRWRRHLKAKLW